MSALLRAARAAARRAELLPAAGREELADIVVHSRADIASVDASVTQFDRSKPTLLKGAAQGWAARQRWGREEFLERFGDLRFKLRPCVRIHEYSYTGPWQKLVSLREYFDDSAQAAKQAESFPAVIFENSFMECDVQKELWSDCALPPALTDIHAEPIFSVARRHTYVGFHSHKASWLAQIQGRKAWWLAPPEQEMPPVREPWSYVEDRPDGVQLCVAEPGDVLFVPEGWWHATWNLDNFVVGIGWESPDDGSSADWHAGMHAVADGELEGLSQWRATSEDAPTQEMLYLAARAGRPEVMQYLLEWLGSRSCGKLHFGVIASGAAISGHLKALELLQPLSLRDDAWHPWVLQAAALCGQQRVVAWLLEGGADQNARDELSEEEWAPDHFVQDGLTWVPIHAASWSGHADVVRQLLAADADVMARIDGKPCETPTEDVQEGSLLLCRVPTWRPALEGAGATALHLAARRGHLDVVEALLSSQCPELVDAVDGGDATALHRAASGGHRQVVEALLAHGADPGAKANGAWTPAMVAEVSGFKDIAKYLNRQRRS